jgi:sulfite exporter TauE/SafE
MSAALPLSLFLLGLASGLHCAGMCGGISAGFAMVNPDKVWKRQILFNLGRITSYAAAGAAAGALGSAGAYAVAAVPAQTLLYLLASLCVVLAGLHLAGIVPLHHLEKAGVPLWRRLQPLAARLLRTRAYAAGLVWGWLPCGLVYAALLAAVFAGGAAEGAFAMAAFGAGTLPWLLAVGVTAARVRGWQGMPLIRRAAGALLIGFGAWGVAHGVEQTILCL